MPDNRLWAYLKGKVFGLRISTRMMFFYGMLLALSLSLSSLLYQSIYYNIMLQKVSSISMQILQSISSNILSSKATVNNYSKMIMSNESVQSLLRESPGYSDPDTQRKVNRFLYEILSSFPDITSIYIMDKNKHKYFINNTGEDSLQINYNSMAKWYKDAKSLKGSSFFRLNGGDAFVKAPGESFISCIRIINDLNSQKPIGYLIVNISKNLFIKSYLEVVKEYDTKIILNDERNKEIAAEYVNIDEKVLKTILNKKVRNYNSEIVKINGAQLVSYFLIRDMNWKIISIMPFEEIEKDTRIIGMAAFIIIFINSFFVFVGSIFVAGMITKPINNLVKSMRANEKGELKKVEFKTGIREFIRLKKGYNRMIAEIQRLVEKIIIEQKIKRKVELDVLQAQIKPHFLYNTFDSISSLAMMGKNEEVLKMVTALGRYYRISLSSGKEIITIKEEVEAVKSYLSIQKIRYGNLFSTKYDLDDNVNDYKILKIVLQPLVENCLYHGIKMKGEPGVIKISTKKYNDVIELVVEDDGVGMDNDIVNDILRQQKKSKKSLGFGMKGTIQRLKIFYGNEDIIKIHSKKGQGTKIIISIPLGHGEVI